MSRRAVSAGTGAALPARRVSTDELKDAAAQLRGADYLHMRFDGFIEADRLGRGEADVIVTDGFSGNIALKSLEGTARFVTDLLRNAFSS